MHHFCVYTPTKHFSLLSTMDGQDEKKAISSPAAIFNLRNVNFNSPLQIVCFYRTVKNADCWEQPF